MQTGLAVTSALNLTIFIVLIDVQELYMYSNKKQLCYIIFIRIYSVIRRDLLAVCSTCVYANE